MDETKPYDYIIVGGGASGCVLANRLSSRASNRVLLIEAGPDVRDGQAPEQILDSFAAHAFLDSRWLWNDLLVSTAADADSSVEKLKPSLKKYEQARVMGGGGSINGQLANRGAPADYDDWERLGATGWSWQTVLPYFRKLERDLDFEGPLHGSCGPIPIRRIFPDLWAEHALAMAEGFRSLGFKYLPDQNGEFEDGYHPFTINNILDRRVTPAIAYLGPGTRLRANLEILAETTVTELLFDGPRCSGVKTIANGNFREHRAREIILAAGAIHTPAHLLRAGIGPSDQLLSLGIPVRRNVPGVGRGLTDHPAIAIGAFVKPHARLNGRTRRHLLVGLRFSSGHPDAPPGDMAVSVSTKAAWHAVGSQIASVTMWVNKTFSDQGDIRLRSREWQTMPEVNFRLLHDQRDLERLMGAFRRLSAIFEVPAVQAAVSDPFPAAFGDKVRQVSIINRKNAALTSILAKLLDGPDVLRRLLLRKLVAPGPSLHELLADDRELEAFVRGAAFGVWHSCGTCRMGRKDDPRAVTDSSGKVRGVDGLRVVDASLFPSIPRANIHLSVLMCAEKLADEMLEEARVAPP